MQTQGNNGNKDVKKTAAPTPPTGEKATDTRPPAGQTGRVKVTPAESAARAAKKAAEHAAYLAKLTPEELAQYQADKAADKSDRAPRMVYIVTGELLEFKTKTDAEKFLNSPEGEKHIGGTFIMGNKVTKAQKVTLR